MSQAQLAAAVSELGVPWKRSTVVNLETRATGSRGKGAGRDAVTVKELLALAVVLSVPPVWLLVDPRFGTPVPLAEGIEGDPWGALMWLTGLQPLAETVDEGRWNLAAQPMGWAAEVARIVNGMDQAEEMRAMGVQEPGYPDRGADEADVAARNDRQRFARLVPLLTRLHESGWTLPELSPYTLARAKELKIELPGSGG